MTRGPAKAQRSPGRFHLGCDVGLAEGGSGRDELQRWVGTIRKPETGIPCFINLGEHGTLASRLHGSTFPDGWAAQLAPPPRLG